jgi:hypothetical protein
MEEGRLENGGLIGNTCRPSGAWDLCVGSSQGLRAGLMSAASPARWRRRPQRIRTRPALLGCGVVVVADDARNFPCAVFVLPQINELPFTNGFCVLMSRARGAPLTHQNLLGGLLFRFLKGWATLRLGLLFFPSRILKLGTDRMFPILVERVFTLAIVPSVPGDRPP